MMVIKPVPVRLISVLKACSRSSNITRIIGMGMGEAPPPPPPPQAAHVDIVNNPCLDLFFKVSVKDTPAEADANRMYLKQLLPVAWSHNPLTTLKLICNLVDRQFNTKYDVEAFYAATFWLHHHHPKTLVANLLPIAGSFGYFGGMKDLVYMLYRILSGHDVCSGSCRHISIEDEWSFEDMMFSTANKVAAERHERDAEFRFLHDRVSDLFAHCLTRDIQNLKKRMRMDNDDDGLEVTRAADSLDHRATFLCESIARKVFKHLLQPEEKEDGYRLRERLRKEVLEPLRKASDPETVYTDPRESNMWGFGCKFDRTNCAAKQYLEDVKAGGGEYSKIEAGALLPHEIIRYVNDENVGKVAELQWKAMLEDMMININLKKQGNDKTKKKKNLSNSLAVCDVCPLRMRWAPGDVSVGLGLLISQLSEEPAWRGMVINLSRNPLLHSIPQGGGLHYDLKSKCEFIRRMDCPDWDADFQKVFDLILQVAVSGNLKPEQMIKKVFVFTSGLDFDEASAYRWERHYEAIHGKFKEKGYGDVVPGLVFWDVICSRSTPVPCAKQGVTTFSGYSENLVKSFLDNDGEIGPEQVMEAAISDQPYQTLVVMD